MDIFTVSLFGHRDISDPRDFEERLFRTVTELLRKKDYVTFLLGRNGDFDIYAASVIKRAQRELGYKNAEVVCVLPYANKNSEYYERYYDGVIIPECVEKIHPKNAIKTRNRWMVEQSELVICFVKRHSGGAYLALKYGEKLGKRVVNISSENCE